MKKEKHLKISEIIGIMYGDGSLQISKNNTYVIRIFGNLHKDSMYKYHIMHLFKYVFNVELKCINYQHKNCFELYYYSKKLLFELNNKYQVPLSPKKLDIIPDFVFRYRSSLIAFIRGIFDTDGCFYVQKDRKYRYPMIKITTKHYNFAINITNSLTSIGIKSYVCQKKDKEGRKGYDVVCRSKNALKFITIIGSKNKRNKTGWGHWDSNF